MVLYIFRFYHDGAPDSHMGVVSYGRECVKKPQDYRAT